MAYSPRFPGLSKGIRRYDGRRSDAGLRAYMLRVYNWMASGLLLTGVVAYVIANTSLINAFYPLVQTPFGFAHQPTALAMIAISRRWPSCWCCPGGQQAVDLGGAGLVLGVLRGDGRQPDEHLPGLHQ